MGSTNGVLLPYPELTETADGPAALAGLANSIEDYFFDRVLPGGITRYVPYHWGTGTTYPTTGGGLKAGDTYYHSTLGCTMRYTGSVWRQSHLATLTAVQRQALTSAILHDGFEVFETDTDRVVYWNGSRWRLRTAEATGTTGGTNSGWAGTTFAWVAGLGAKIVIPADGIARRWQAVANCNITGDGYLRIRADLAVGSGGTPAASSSYGPGSNGFRQVVTSSQEYSLALQHGGDLDGDQALTLYLEARSNVAASGSFILPQLSVVASAAL